jgi:hypothetical protein
MAQNHGASVSQLNPSLKLAAEREREREKERERERERDCTADPRLLSIRFAVSI